MLLVCTRTRAGRGSSGSRCHGVGGVLPRLVAIGVLSTSSATALGDPVISSLAVDPGDPELVVVTGSGFSEKASPRPLFYWSATEADDGIQPSPLGRMGAWSDTFRGEISTEQTAPGSERSARYDHGRGSGAALSKVDFGAETTRVFVQRKIFEDYDIVDDVGIRVRVEGCNEDNPVIDIGDVMEGATSGAVGVVDRVSIRRDRCDLYFANDQGTQGGMFPLRFEESEVMRSNRGAEVVNIERNGVLLSFNDKIIRFWAREGVYPLTNNIHVNAQGANGPTYSITPEQTDGTLFPSEQDSPIDQRGFVWHVQSFEYGAASGIDVRDGVFRFYQSNSLASDARFIMQRDDKFQRYESVSQHQVSNGAQVGSYTYYDHLYVDDSWHRVVLCASPTWNTCRDTEVQIPVDWSDTEISFRIRYRSIPLADAYLYVFDADGNVNAEGFSVCPECIKDVSLLSVQ
jgi:hypothetical protein